LNWSVLLDGALLLHVVGISRSRRRTTWTLVSPSQTNAPCSNCLAALSKTSVRRRALRS
jgi:hypothetical protein